MKKVLLISLLSLVSVYIYSQAPGYFNYQAVIKNTNRELISNQDVKFKISIIPGSISGTAIYSEIHDVTSNDAGLCNLQIGNGNSPSSDFSLINWAMSTYFLKVELDDNGDGTYTDMGTVQLLSVPYSLHANSASYAATIDNPVLYFTDSDTLFAVKDREGNIVFAVFPDGAELYVNQAAKGKVGGFAISGRSPNKATDEDYFVVTADSTRVYVNQDQGKGKVGGFAISGRSPNKATTDNFMDITPDNYFIGHESGKNTETYIGNDIGKYNVFLGYQAGMENLSGRKNVFIGYKAAQANTHGQTNVYIGSESGYNNTDGYDNVFIGSSTGYNNTDGLNNVFLGSRSGFSNLDGDDNVFVGFESGYNNTTGLRNTFIGKGVGRANVSGSDNIFIGEQSGYSNINGSENIFIGKRTGQFVESAVKNTFIGSYSGQQVTTGTENTFLGHMTGLGVKEGSQNTYIGASAVNRDSSGVDNVALGFNAGGWSYGNRNVYIGVAAGMNYEGDSSIFIGYNAGFNATEPQRLYIENTDSPTPLIYGEFDNDKVEINGSLNVNGSLAVNGSINYGVATGANNYTVTIPGIKEYTEGLALYIKFDETNTSGVTLNINELGPIGVITSGLALLTGSELNGGSIYMLIFDGTNFQIITM
ncbi:MAG: hypothetical protein KQH79_08470 [Bacteroidetes bacterium]|nr:hypothetical protein [Bacteroidota bacterium]